MRFLSRLFLLYQLLTHAATHPALPMATSKALRRHSPNTASPNKTAQVTHKSHTNYSFAIYPHLFTLSFVIVIRLAVS